MSINRDELEKKIMAAESAEEIAELLKADGQAITPGKAGLLLKKVQALRDRELSLEELEAVSGGAERDWVTDGCAATVEPNSWCDELDACWFFDVTYEHEPIDEFCPVCNSYLYVDKTYHAPNPSDDVKYCRCKNCGYTKSY